MNNQPPYYGYPYYGHQNQANLAPAPQDQPTDIEKNYKNQNSKTHLAMGVVAGAAIAYLLTNKKFKQGVTATGEKAWSAVRGEVEELKERLEDTQAELDYYRNLHKGEE